MAVTDKWQKREAEQYVKDNGGTYEEAVAILFPDEEAPAAVAEDKSTKAAPKVSVDK